MSSSAEKIKDEIMQLPHDELREFRKWYEKFDAEKWDRQIDEDAAEGKLDSLAAKALADHEDGKSKLL